FASSECRENFFVRAFSRSRVEIHPKRTNSGESFREFIFYALSPDSTEIKFFTSAGRTALIFWRSVSAVMTAHIVSDAMPGQRHRAVRTHDDIAAVRASQICRKAAPVLQKHDALLFLQPLFDGIF